jgi:hypothetical protein
MRTALAVVALLVLELPTVAWGQAERIAFPRDAWVVDAKRDLGAKGDGIADDTDALQKGLDQSCGQGSPSSRVLFLPNGVYKVTRTLIVKSAVGPWVYGESRDKTIIRLADGVRDVTAVLRTHPSDGGHTSADWFMRNLRNFTIDVGQNPETDGIRWFATNTGMLKNVRIIGRGKVGVNSGFMGQNGPNLVQDVEIDGFETGVSSQWIWGQTLSRVTIRNCRKTGLYVSANVVAAEDLVVENTPQPVVCDLPNDWYWWGGVVAVVGGRFTHAAGEGAAITNKSILYARNIQTKGFKLAIESRSPNGNVAGPNVNEYLSHPAHRAFDAPERGLALPIKPEPVVPWETDPRKWECANDHGAKYGDNQDDTAALQKAIDAAAKAGKTTVYLRGIGGGDPNWYNVEGEIRVHGSVRHILGLGFGRILGGKKGRFIVTDASAPVVKFQNIDAFGGTPVVLENRSRNRSMVVESCGVTIEGNGQGDIFAADTPANLHLRRSGQRMWCRHLNPEGKSDVGLVQNDGGDLWVLGMKFEGTGVRVATRAGGRTEAFGVFNYGSGMPAEDQRPMFEIDNAAVSIQGLREIVFNGGAYAVKFRETRGKETKTVGKHEHEHYWIGWACYSGWSERTK